ncbi:hypothetical protein AURANDRAFT_71604 [Aureococcus anophagefferens]|uniref:Cation/H+ exchanger transmembrane domain-containing protein n=1 Tax=Aureococcus anophagefferens TaxID=44056 RepID=F0Y8T5_AURAN|nr:hypothetical protein AURANDRAFT_71604 [Aureococcus anophagefferens]EGB08653.1 hypothetical protein AURANDRAFT_71604 [Aureococcus anophagefferens]|eukprot:XP_009036644.1 hypothetical protein AURANDRAFT_71604 [Aureococcus anophagefferens]
MSELGVSKRLATLLEGESLLNDGTAIVIFSVFYRRCAREGVSSLGFAVVAPYALRMALCGPLLGAAVGQAASVFLGFVYEDPVAEIALTLAAAYGTFCLCEMVTVDGASFTSGVLALVALGVTLGARGREHGTAAAAHRLHAFWELAGFVANTSIFFVAGAMIASRVSLGRLGELCALYVALMAVRFAMLALLSPLLRRMGYGFGLPQFGALGWGALRGAVGLALALVVEENENIDARVRDDVMSAVAGITCLTLVVNGTSMEFALAKLGLSQPSVEEERRFRATCRELGERSDATLRDVVERDRYLGGADAAVVCQYLPVHDAATYASRSPRAREARVPFVLRRRWAGYDARFKRAPPPAPEAPTPRSAREVWGEERRVAAVLKAELWHLHHAGFVSADSLELLAEVCDVAVDRIFRLEKGPAGGAARGGAGDAEAAVAERASLWDGVLRPRLEAYAIDLDFPERCGGGPLKAWRLFKLQFAFECATNFARACERAARDAAAGGEDASAGRLRDDVGKAEAWIGAYASAFPEMARTVKTEAAVRVLLRREAANAEKLLHSGRIDCGERERFARKLAISERKCGLQYSGLVSFFDFLFTGHSEAFADVGACLRAAPELAAVGDVAPLARLGRDAVLGADDDLERALAGAWAFVVSGGLRVCGATFGPGSCVGLALCANQIFNPTSMCAYSKGLAAVFAAGAAPPCCALAAPSRCVLFDVAATRALVADALEPPAAPAASPATPGGGLRAKLAASKTLKSVWNLRASEGGLGDLARGLARAAALDAARRGGGPLGVLLPSALRGACRGGRPRRAPDADNGALGFGGEGYVEDPCELPEAAWVLELDAAGAGGLEAALAAVADHARAVEELRSHARAPRDRSGGPGVRRRAPTLAAALEAAATPGGPAPPAPSPGDAPGDAPPATALV